MADWFEQNAPAASSGGGWFAANAPDAKERMKREQPTPVAPRPYMPGLDAPPPQKSLPERAVDWLLKPDSAGAPLKFPDTGIGHYLGEAMNAPANGMRQTAKGMGQMTDPGMPAKAQGASNILRGAATGLAPLVLPEAAAAAPLRTAVTLGAAALAQKGTEAGANALGVRPEYSALAGDVAGLAAGGLAAKANPPMPGEILPRLTRVEPKQAITQAIKPRSTQVNFNRTLDRALPEVKAAEADIGKPVESVDDALAAAKIAKQKLWGQYNQIMGPRASWAVDGSPIADAMEASIPNKLKLENPRAAQAIVDRAKLYRKNFSVQDLENLLQETNAELDAYHGKYPASKAADLKADPETAYKVAQSEALRSTLYGALDESGEGAAPAELKRRYGAVSELQDTLQRRKNVADRQQPDSIQQQMSKLGAAYEAGKGAVKLLTGNPSGAADIAGAVAQRSASAWLKEQNTTNGLLKRAFRDYDGQSVPVDVPPAPEVKGLLPPGPIRMPGPPDQSGPIPNAGPQRNPGYWTPQQPPALPSPPIAAQGMPDTSGIIKGWQPTILKPEGLPDLPQLPAPGNPPIVTPPPADTSGIRVTDAVPVVDPETGEILYYASASKTNELPYLRSPEAQ